MLFYWFHFQNDLYHTIEALTRIAHSRQNSEGYVMSYVMICIACGQLVFVSLFNTQFSGRQHWNTPDKLNS